MTAATSFAKREAQQGHTENLKFLNTSSEISFADSNLEDECTVRLSELTGRLKQLNQCLYAPLKIQSGPISKSALQLLCANVG